MFDKPTIGLLSYHKIFLAKLIQKWYNNYKVLLAQRTNNLERGRKMRGTVIGSLRLDKLTVKTENGYVSVTLRQEDIPEVKKEFGVEYAKDIIDKEIEVDVGTHRIYAVTEEDTKGKKTPGVLCSSFRF